MEFGPGRVNTPQGGKHRAGGDDGAAAAGGGAATSASPDAAPLSDLETGRNPFRATYGLLPGSSSAYAYQIFLPGDEAASAGGAGAYAGLQSGPRAARGGPGRAAQPAAP
ncbi:hypothetical protein TSOC_007754 [Tetrabaena socialis]|uniref:Uncharacterized protein n=1 Tax=Tetrabaena socialis TaxID=47790 RepID=A0A2J8A099_9CHLO|nr:hypothetical protein TSOC_007754 [Tetrabaena socialis]|eukprot:PNH05944.1 hypothetical protein TSOC_007754 [Tetrabaena socialis]